MKRNYRKWLLPCLFLALITLSQSIMAQAVIFPQKEQPGTAKVKAKKGEYTLSNKLFSAKFVEKDGKLTFAGSSELGLLPDTELFKIRLADGKEVLASDMKMGEVRTLSLKGDKNAVKGSKRFNGQAIEADFECGNLDIVWRAVLRDGSHYLRTEMDITADGKDVEMHFGEKANPLYERLAKYFQILDSYGFIEWK